MRILVVLFSFFAAVTSANPPKNSVWSWTDDDRPPPRTAEGPYTPSACGNGGNGGGDGGGWAFACPHHAMLSDDMLAAAASDGLDPAAFVYAVAGSAHDAQCGECYQVQLLDAERVWSDAFPQLVVQIVNSGFDVMQGQLDLFVGAGGFGYFTACNADCSTQYCNGGPCRQGMFAGDFGAWTAALYSDPHRCYEGGIKLLNETTPADVAEKCRALLGTGGGGGGGATLQGKNAVLHDTCVRGNLQLFHQNFVSSRYLRVQCPQGLYMLTGLRRADEEEDLYPLPHADNRFTNDCLGSREGGKYCVTTMMDCCVPSCAWPGKVAVDPSWRRVDRCDVEGNVLM